jgi:Cdc6-like AAA superfamily ATPase
MTNSANILAANLTDAYEICDVEPLQGKGLERFYLPLLEARNSEAITQVGQILQQQKPESFSTILFTGHRGCGKSTELRRIEDKCKDQYLTVFLNVEDETDINDLDYIDIYLMVIGQVEQALRDPKIKITFDQQLLKSVEDWFKVVTTEDERSVALSLDVEASASLGSEASFFAKLLFKLKGVFKNSSSQKTTIRETLKKEFTRMKGDINLLLGDGLKKLRKKFPNYKGFLVIVDNLDRCPLAVSDKLFFDYAAQLTSLHCSIIYTVPISALYSSRGLSNSFDDPHIVPMVNIYELDRAKYPLDFNQKSLEAVAKIIEKRVDVNVIFDSRRELMELVKASGGHIRQLMQLMQRACLTASGREHEKILAKDVEYAIKQLQFSLERSLSNKKYFNELAYIALNKDFSDEEDVKVQMLYSTAVLEYNGSDRWNYPNPLLMRSNAFTNTISSLPTL